MAFCAPRLQEDGSRSDRRSQTVRRRCAHIRGGVIRPRLGRVLLSERKEKIVDNTGAEQDYEVGAGGPRKNPVPRMVSFRDACQPSEREAEKKRYDAHNVLRLHADRVARGEKP